jgi:hypothetical protein
MCAAGVTAMTIQRGRLSNGRRGFVTFPRAGYSGIKAQCNPCQYRKRRGQ